MRHVLRNPWFRHYVDRCQCIAGSIGHGEPLIALSEIRRLFRDLPTELGIIEQFCVRSLFGQLIGRLARAYRLDDASAVTQAFVAFTSCGLSGERWRASLTGLLDAIDLVLAAATANSLVHGQVERALRVLDARCTDPHLNLEAVAKHIDLSPFHLSRLLKMHTGEGFIAHLHERRVSAARKLLADPDRSVKEIAASVGYRSVTQLGRHFRRIYGVTPTASRTDRPSPNAIG